MDFKHACWKVTFIGMAQASVREMCESNLAK